MFSFLSLTWISVVCLSVQVLVVVHCPAPHYIPALVSAGEWRQLAEESTNPDSHIVVAHIADVCDFSSSYVVFPFVIVELLFVCHLL